MAARLGDDGIQDAVIVLAGLRLELLPVDGDLEGIDLEGRHGGPDLRQGGRPGAGVVALGAEDQKGLAIDDQGMTSVLLDEMRQRGIGGLGEGEGEHAADEGADSDDNDDGHDEIALWQDRFHDFLRV